MKKLAAIFKGTDVHPFMRGVSAGSDCAKTI
jgi:hypothetical protein